MNYSVDWDGPGERDHDLAPGCNSAASPCDFQKEFPRLICDTCFIAMQMRQIDQLRQAATMAKTRLDDFADKANAGHVHYSARELKRKIGAAFADFDALVPEKQSSARR